MKCWKWEGKENNKCKHHQQNKGDRRETVMYRNTVENIDTFVKESIKAKKFLIKKHRGILGYHEKI